MKFPYLLDSVIEREAATLLHTVFGGAWRERVPVDLEAIVYDYLSPRDDLVFNDEADLPPENGEVVLGKTLPIRGKILLNRALKDGEAGRARFTLAHELGHWVLHRKLFLAQGEMLDLFAGTPSQEDDFEFVGLNRGIFPASSRSGAVPREEWQANRFAVALLLDPVVLREEFETRFGAHALPRFSGGRGTQQNSIRAVAAHAASARVDGRPALRDVFGLSTEAMAIALESRGYVVDELPMI